jgi:hypothetical protein
MSVYGQRGGAVTGAVFDFAGSRHDLAGIGCADCHGGNTTDDEKAHGDDFVSTNPTALLEACRTCHGVEAGHYASGAHHQEKPNWRYPTCSTCHGGHPVGKGVRRMGAVCVDCHGTRAEATTGSGESEIVWRSRVAGTDGNEISIELVADGGPRPLSLAYERTSTGLRLTVFLATDRNGLPETTAEQVIDAIRNKPELYYVVDAQEGGLSLGEGIVEPVERFSLTGGQDIDGRFPAHAKLVRANDALSDSLESLRKQSGHPTPGLTPELNELRANIRKDTAELIHAVPVEDETVHPLTRRIRDFQQRIQRLLSRSKTEGFDG